MTNPSHGLEIEIGQGRNQVASDNCGRTTVLSRATMLIAAAACVAAEPAVAPPALRKVPAEERRQIMDGLKELNTRLATLRVRQTEKSLTHSDYFADAEIFTKGITWALRFDTDLPPADVTSIKRALVRAEQRLTALETGRQPWTESKGRIPRGFVSAVDGSVQPYGVVVPAGYDRAKPMRLDVVLHGSSRPDGVSELRFLRRFDDDGTPVKDIPTNDYLELHPLGRVENCYRWAGETDVFEAIEAVCRNYSIDRRRIVLRGMSMGASGTWHLGLKHPDRFVALGPYCGYVDTHQFSQTPLPTFVKVGALPPYQEKALHLLDSIDYAANAGIVPTIACMGEKDVFFQAHVLMGQAMSREGLKMVNLIAPGTGHVVDPATHQEQMRRIGEYAAKGQEPFPKHIRFVTWSLKYSRCHWLQVLALGEHYARAELDAKVKPDGSIEIEEPKNVTRFSIRLSAPPPVGARLRVGRREIAPPRRVEGDSAELVVRQRDDGWELATAPLPVSGKRPGLQGPIDDAFTGPFLCVRGTGRPWNATVQAWSEATLKRFAYEWRRYFRGELRVKDDREVSEDDLRRYHLILFGDPGSNRWLARVLPHLPIQWSRDNLRVGGAHYRAVDHAPVLIHPNPLAAGRYVVVNSGHTFHEKELASLNYLLFPRLGDWAVLQVGVKVASNPSEALEERVVRAGFMDEQWHLTR